jgi:hypothetical protein
LFRRRIWLVTWQVFVEPYTTTDAITFEIAPDDNHVSEAIKLG